MKNIKELLPVGSVVILKEGTKQLMVIGVMQEDTDGKQYDYLGVFYPEGFIGQEALFLFQEEEVKEVFFEGYKSPEQEEFLQKLENYF